MKLLTIVILFLLGACNNVPNKKRNLISNEVDAYAEMYKLSSPEEDSARWLCYAYMHRDTVYRNGKREVSSVLSCEMPIDTIYNIGDSIVYKFRLCNDSSFNYIVTRGNINAFTKIENTYIPNCLNYVFIFENELEIQKSNKREDSLFRIYLSKAKLEDLSLWLQKEVKKKGILI